MRRLVLAAVLFATPSADAQNVTGFPRFKAFAQYAGRTTGGEFVGVTPVATPLDRWVCATTAVELKSRDTAPGRFDQTASIKCTSLTGVVEVPVTCPNTTAPVSSANSAWVSDLIGHRVLFTITCDNK